jgi:hypothetical protein
LAWNSYPIVNIMTKPNFNIRACLGKENRLIGSLSRASTQAIETVDAITKQDNITPGFCQVRDDRLAARCRFEPFQGLGRLQGVADPVAPGPKTSSAPLSRSERRGEGTYSPARARKPSLIVALSQQDYNDSFYFWQVFVKKSSNIRKIRIYSTALMALASSVSRTAPGASARLCGASRSPFAQAARTASSPCAFAPTVSHPRPAPGGRRAPLLASLSVLAQWRDAVTDCHRSRLRRRPLSVFD